MPRLRPVALCLCLLVPRMAGAADGAVDLYLQPLPPEAARLTFVIASVSAVAASGAEYPLELRLPAIRAAETGRQRLLASGRLPAGTYAGFVVKVKQAALKGEQGESALLVPPAPALVDIPFAVAGSRASLFWLVFRYEDSISSGVSFNPVFSAVTPSKPIVDHAGFVSNSGSHTITVFDKSLAQAAASIDACAGPAGMALDQRRRSLYVACSRDDEVLSIDVASNEIVERTRLLPGDGPRELALTPDGATLVSVNTRSNSITFFQAGSLTRLERVSVGSGPGSILIDAEGRRAFVFNTLSGSVSVVDIASRTVAATMSTDSAPLRGQFNGRGDRLYVIHERSPFMTVVDPRQLTVVTRARLRLGVGAIKVDSRRDLVYVGGRNDTTVEFYDPTALVPVDVLRTGDGVSYLTMDVEDNSLYMVSPDRRRLVIASLARRRVTSTIDVGESPYWVAVMGER